MRENNGEIDLKAYLCVFYNALNTVNLQVRIFKDSEKRMG